jgi:hypothetical protein
MAARGRNLQIGMDVRACAGRSAIYRAAISAAYRPACGKSPAGLAGGLTGTKRVSLLPEAGAFDDRKMASNRNMKISDNMFMLLARRHGASCERTGLA